MTQEEKQLLLKDLCARLPYGVMVSVQGGEFESYKYPYQLTAVSKFGLESFCKVYHPIYTPFGVPKVEDVKPYLRPMSSMTEEEAFEMSRTVFHQVNPMGVEIESDRFRFKMVDSDGHFAGHTVLFFDKIYSLEQIDWLNEHHFDYRGLIDKGLALEAPKGMYKTE